MSHCRSASASKPAGQHSGARSPPSLQRAARGSSARATAPSAHRPRPARRQRAPRRSRRRARPAGPLPLASRRHARRSGPPARAAAAPGQIVVVGQRAARSASTRASRPAAVVGDSSAAALRSARRRRRSSAAPVPADPPAPAVSTAASTLTQTRCSQRPAPARADARRPCGRSADGAVGEPLELVRRPARLQRDRRQFESSSMSATGARARSPQPRHARGIDALRPGPPPRRRAALRGPPRQRGEPRAQLRSTTSTSSAIRPRVRRSRPHGARAASARGLHIRALVQQPFGGELHHLRGQHRLARRDVPTARRRAWPGRAPCVSAAPTRARTAPASVPPAASITRRCARRTHDRGFAESSNRTYAASRHARSSSLGSSRSWMRV